MGEDIPADICLHPHAEHMTPIVDDVHQQSAHHIGAKRNHDEADKHAHHRGIECHLRQQRTQDVLREHRVCNIDDRDQHRTG